MCGLAVLFSVTFGPDRVRNCLEEMLRVQRHRGPDNWGAWYDTISDVSIGLGLNRLKILDLSDDANQPMISKDGRFVLVFNGEIYNYVELRSELATAGAVFRTQSDTEVVLEALIRWGSEAFARFNGMWALAILDRETRELTVSRDRFGIKPLYTYADNQGFYISSEIKAILESTGKKFSVTYSVANAFLRQNLLCTGRKTFFQGIEEFPAGHWAVFSLNEPSKKALRLGRYWEVPTTPLTCSNEDDLIELFRSTFIDSVKIRLRSDVPVGVLLSGGMDSSSIAAAVHYLTPHRNDIKLFSAVGQYGNDEQPFIDALANHLKRKVDKVVLDYPPSKALNLLGEASWYNDEPVGSFSTIAHFLLMNHARDSGITVLLSGQGADEILCGYRKYLFFYLQELVSSGQWLLATQVIRSFLSTGSVLSQIDYRETKRYLPRWLRIPEIDIRGPGLLGLNGAVPVGLNGQSLIQRQIDDLEALSIPALVHYEDRMSMSAGREIRLPFLDYRLVSLLVPLPVKYKLREGWTKWILRRAMEPLLPKKITWRTDKQSFIVPQNEWFRSELRPQIQTLLKGDLITERLSLIDRVNFKKRYEAYLRQPSNGSPLGFKDIFAPVALEIWARRFERYLST